VIVGIYDWLTGTDFDLLHDCKFEVARCVCPGPFPALLAQYNRGARA
jgi:hypothetical protein